MSTWLAFHAPPLDAVRWKEGARRELATREPIEVLRNVGANTLRFGDEAVEVGALALQVFDCGLFPVVAHGERG